MTNVSQLPAVQQQDAAEIMEAVLLAGDLSKLSAQERTSYYFQTCKSLGLNPLTKPFDYIRLSGREVLYAKRDCADQLRKINRISLEIIDRKISGDLLVVAVRATTPDGRSDEDMGVVSVKGLAGEALGNAMLKAVTKAKRRVTLSICGLGMLDETEVRSVLEAEALAGPVDPHPKPRIAAPALAAPAAEAKTAVKHPLEVAVPGGWDPVTFERSKRGLREALVFMGDAIIEGGAAIVTMNAELLDTIGAKLPELAEQVAALRAAADEAMLSDPAETEAEDPDDDTFPGGMSPGA